MHEMESLVAYWCNEYLPRFRDAHLPALHAVPHYTLKIEVTTHEIDAAFAVYVWRLY